MTQRILKGLAAWCDTVARARAASEPDTSSSGEDEHHDISDESTSSDEFSSSNSDSSGISSSSDESDESDDRDALRVALARDAVLLPKPGGVCAIL